MELLTTLQWIMVALFVGPTLYFGYAKMVAEPSRVNKFVTWGYPTKMMQIIGVVEIVGSISILFPELRLFGIILWAIILTGAVFVKILRNESKKEVYSALTVLAHLTIILALNVVIK